MSKSPVIQTAAAWWRNARRMMIELIGAGDDELVRNRLAFYSRVAQAAEAKLSNQPCLLLRCPARVNLVGMHIEHQGGAENPICIPREHVAFVTPRDDDRLIVDNVNESFKPFECSLNDLPSRDKTWRDWCRDNAPTQRGDWGSYIIGATAQLLRLEAKHTWRGAHIVLGSDIPLAAGLSSSSALVMITMEALRTVNHVEMTDAQRIRAAGAAELVAGTLGGDGDGSAMVNARAGRCVHHRFFPYEACTYALPPGLGIILADSCAPAHKQTNARDTFNERITCYKLGTLALRAELGTLEHLGELGDQSHEHYASLYHLLKTVPRRLTRADAYRRYADSRDELDFIFSTHTEPGDGYRVRRRVLFGLAEMQRARWFKTAAERNDCVEMGRLKTIGHNGDRVVWPTTTEDEDLDRLAMNDIPLAYVNGAYECSTPQIDALVDAANVCEGVYGAGLTGAGLGGSVVVLCDNEYVDRIINNLRTSFYRPHDLPDHAVQAVHSVHGLGAIHPEAWGLE